MKKRFLLLFTLLLLSGIVFSPGCKKTEATTGTISVYVLDFFSGFPMVNEKVYIATSYSNLQQGIYFATAWTDFNGRAFFGEITPGIYYYDTYSWQDWGAVRAFAGIDQYVVLYVNTPAKKAGK